MRYGPREVHSWPQLTAYFLRQFNSGREASPDVNTMSCMKQSENESLHNFIKSFKSEALQIGMTCEEALLIAAYAGIRNTILWDKDNRKSCYSMKTFYERASGYIKKKKSGPQSYLHLRELLLSQWKKRGQKDTHPSAMRHREINFAAKTFLTIHPIRYMRWPALNWPTTSQTRGRSQNKTWGVYCRFHRANEYRTDNCRHLRNEIERSIQKGYLGSYQKENNGKGLGISLQIRMKVYQEIHSIS